YPRKRTLLERVGMSALCRYRCKKIFRSGASGGDFCNSICQKQTWPKKRIATPKASIAAARRALAVVGGHGMIGNSAAGWRARQATLYVVGHVRRSTHKLT